MGRLTIKVSNRFNLFKLALVSLVLGGVSLRCSGKDPLRLEKEIPLPGVEGRIDHFGADEARQRLFIAAIGNGSVEIVDVQKGERTAEIKGLNEPQGAFYNTKTNRLYVATGGDGKLGVYDGTTLALQQTAEFGDDADNVRYDRRSGDIWVGYGSGGLGIVDSTGQKIGAIELGSHPESFQFEQNGDRVFVNVPKQLGVTVIDRQKRAVVTKWGLGIVLANYPMALDEANNRLFVGCRLPARLVVLDTSSGKVVSTSPTVGDADDIFYDPSKRRIYVIGGEGVIEVFGENGPDDYRSEARIKTAPGARTGFLSASSGYLFVAVPHQGTQMATVLVYSVQ
jgi:DNA-binding beta-propeller fold protein YncE